MSGHSEAEGGRAVCPMRPHHLISRMQDCDERVVSKISGRCRDRRRVVGVISYWAVARQRAALAQGGINADGARFPFWRRGTSIARCAGLSRQASAPCALLNIGDGAHAGQRYDHPRAFREGQTSRRAKRLARSTTPSKGAIDQTIARRRCEEAIARQSRDRS